MSNENRCGGSDIVNATDTEVEASSSENEMFYMYMLLTCIL